MNSTNLVLSTHTHPSLSAALPALNLLVVFNVLRCQFNSLHGKTSACTKFLKAQISQMSHKTSHPSKTLFLLPGICTRLIKYIHQTFLWLVKPPSIISVLENCAVIHQGSILEPIHFHYTALETSKIMFPSTNMLRIFSCSFPPRLNSIL